jgi:hypothetical protein
VVVAVRGTDVEDVANGTDDEDVVLAEAVPGVTRAAPQLENRSMAPLTSQHFRIIPLEPVAVPTPPRSSA